MKVINFIDTIKTMKGNEAMTASELVEILKAQAVEGKFNIISRIITYLFEDMETIKHIQELLK